jgi:hypothetical protein
MPSMTTSAVAGAAVFAWLGMVVAISFLEAPLKFRAPGVSLPLGLGIGRLVFRALNVCELVLALTIAAAFVIRPPAMGAMVASGLAALTLMVQLIVVRPLLTRRTRAVLAGADAPGSHAHLAYIGLESAKVVALLIAGVLLLSS